MAEKKTSPTGRVILAGAGPGAPGLITVRAMQVLAAADVVVYDRLVCPELLANARPDAELIDVGKIAGSQQTSQPLINQLLMAKAKEGKTVVRLKGGDPFVFGRGGEEALALQESGIPFEVIPGVTAGVAVPGSAGIPVTHRGLASCVTFITGHEDPTKSESDLDFRALALTGGTLVFYMGVKQLESIAAKLIAAGLSSETPAAIIERGTTAAQRSVRGTLADIARRAAEAGIQPPAITVIGAVAGLPDSLNVFERRLLFGKRIVNTRPAGQATELTEELEGLGAEVIQLPAIVISPPATWDGVDAELAGLGSYDWVIFTSANAVEIVFDRLGALGLDARAFRGAKIACIGPATAEALGAHALRPDFVPADYLAESLLAELARAHDLCGKRVLLPRSDVARKELREGLEKLGAKVTEVTLYHTRTNPSPPAGILERVRRGECDVVTFTSSSTVQGFVEIVGREAVDRLKSRVAFASIGPVTSATARELGIPVAVEAKEHTVAGLVQAILDFSGRRG